MKKAIVLLVAITFAHIAAGQPKDEKIEYFTDYKVSRSIVSMQLFYTPGISNRRLLSQDYPPGSFYSRTQEGAKLGFSQAFGGDIYFRLNKSFDIGVGLNYSMMNFTWDAVRFIDFNTGVALEGEFLVKNNLNYLNMPIQFGFVQQITDLWWLQVYPGIDVSFLQKLERSVTQKNLDFELDPNNFGNITERGRAINLAINFGVGAEYRMADRVGVFSRIQFRYFFFPMIESDIVTEIPYNIGLHTGLRFYF